MQPIRPDIAAPTSYAIPRTQRAAPPAPAPDSSQSAPTTGLTSFAPQPAAPLHARPVANPTAAAPAPLAPDFGQDGSDLSRVVGMVSVGAFTTGNATMGTNGSAPPNPASSAGSMYAVTVIPVADGSLRYLGPYEGPKAHLRGMAMIEYRRLAGVHVAAAGGFGHPAFGVGGYVQVSAQKETLFQTLMAPEDAAKIMQHEAHGHGWWQRRLEALHLRASPVEIPDFADVAALPEGATLCVTLDGKITGGLVMGNAAQRLSVYCSLEGQFQLAVRACGDGIMEVMISPEVISEVGALAGMPLIEKFDCSYTQVHAYRLVYEIDVRSAEGLSAYRGCLRGEWPMGRKARTGVWPACVRLTRVETVDQSRWHIGGGLMAPPLIPSSMHISGLGFHVEDMQRTHVVTDGRNLLLNHTSAHKSSVDLLWRGSRNKTVFVNAQYEVSGDPSVTPPRFCGLVMGTYYSLTKSESHQRKRLIDDLNGAFNLTLPYFPGPEADSGYTMLVRRNLSLADLEVLRRFSLQGDEVATWAKRVGLDTRHLQNILNALQTQDGEETGEGLDPAVLEDNVKGLRTLGALCRLLDADRPRLDVTLECEAYDLAFAAAQNAQLLGLNAIAATDPPKEVAARLNTVGDAREKLHAALRQRSGDVPRAIFLPDTLESLENNLMTALLCVERAGELDHLPPAERAELYADKHVWDALTLFQKADALMVLKRDGRFWNKHHEGHVKDVWQRLQKELSTVPSETELPEGLVQVLVAQLNEARDGMIQTFNFAAPTLRD